MKILALANYKQKQNYQSTVCQNQHADFIRFLLTEDSLKIKKPWN